MLDKVHMKRCKVSTLSPPKKFQFNSSTDTSHPLPTSPPPFPRSPNTHLRNCLDAFSTNKKRSRTASDIVSGGVFSTSALCEQHLYISSSQTESPAGEEKREGVEKRERKKKEKDMREDHTNVTIRKFEKLINGSNMLQVDVV